MGVQNPWVRPWLCGQGSFLVPRGFQLGVLFFPRFHPMNVFTVIVLDLRATSYINFLWESSAVAHGPSSFLVSGLLVRNQGNGPLGSFNWVSVASTGHYALGFRTCGVLLDSARPWTIVGRQRNHMGKPIMCRFCAFWASQDVYHYNKAIEALSGSSTRLTEKFRMKISTENSL